VEVVDSVADYVSLMKHIFDFSSLRDLLKGSEGHEPFRVLINSLNGGKLHVLCYRRRREMSFAEEFTYSCVARIAQSA
jgi:phosphoglucomutase